MVLTNTKYINGRGFIDEKYYFDENKTNYEVKFPNGNVLKQMAPFAYIEHDWQDGRYSLFSAPFENSYGDTQWYCPADLLGFIIKNKIAIDGIERI